MATTITMPQLGETVTEGTVERWLKQPGESVEKYEAFVEVSTDKVNSEVPAPVTGTLREILVQEGTTVATGTAIAIIEEVGAVPAASAAKAASPGAGASVTEPPQTQEAMAASANLEPVPGFNLPEMPVQHAGNGHARVAPPESSSSETSLRGVSPAVRKLAREH